MKTAFLVDANLPLALARMLSGLGADSLHVHDLGLSQAADTGIWRLASERSLTIISKDVDFADLVLATKSGPSVLWVRMGNVRKEVLLERFRRDFPEFCALLASGHRLIEVA
jgi:predicted nuclease of predicted toxin-antitoxin system